MSSLNTKRARTSARKHWEKNLPVLAKYVKIPNRSPLFDAKWKKNGYMDQVVTLFMDWAKKRPYPIKVEKLQIKGRTPLIFMEVAATDDTAGQTAGTVILYGHLDKQPEMEGWLPGLGPWKPVRRGPKFYGRGSADDGYAMFAAVNAIDIVKEQGLSHGRLVVLIEASEESGSPDLAAYMEQYADLIGAPNLVICLDSGCGDYKRLWLTTSLRGVISGNLTVKILTEGVHSGDATGIVTDTFRIARSLISRIEDEETGDIILADLNVPVPEDRLRQAEETANILRHEVFSKFPWAGKAAPPHSADYEDYLLRRTWRPGLAVTGAAGFPPEFDKSGNVLRPFTKLRLSMRIPPTANAANAREAMVKTLTRDPPYGAEVTFEAIPPMDGWNAPSLAPRLEESLNRASVAFFGQPMAAQGEGGSIPFMGMLGKKFPDAQFVITGVLGPHSNAHGPNEFLHVPTAEKITASMAMVIADHAQF